MTQQARYDKQGRRLPDTGRGCGCRQCEVAKAPRYERREPAARDAAGAWHPLQRSLMRLVRSIG
ncbi:MAG TPA: hypothetical protein VFB69_02045 [Candidatus Dormibacteraeota bacterium]|nr:hypothetical protein [Candidatus Dormibacteraeota bacterium]